MAAPPSIRWEALRSEVAEGGLYLQPLQPPNIPVIGHLKTGYGESVRLNAVLLMKFPKRLRER